MKNQKLIHLLLAITLLYGQLVANVHMVGHLHADDCELLSFSSSADCSHAMQAGTHPAEAAVRHEEGAHPQDHAAENDCSIYHALSSLNGLFCVSQIVPASQVLQSVNNHPAGFYPPATVRNAQPIRAPPPIV